MDNTFKIESRADLEFRPAFKSALEILSFQLTTSFEEPSKMQKSLEWLLERVEVNLAGSWVPVKEQGRNLFNPADLQEDIRALNEISMQMFKYIGEIFQKSGKSKH